ncbi:MAG TPA: UDP-N-acetylmuramate dehydrogenase [Streptosporangiaceae bacterium]|nr:UDP-N-acetylmuramate dehydrogenase [Streptosporangiaceae bacterium]
MRELTDQPLLADYTTLRLGGFARRFLEVGTTDELIDAVRAADRAGEPVLVLGGGSNLVVSDAGFEGTVIRVASAGIDLRQAGDRVEVTVAAGENWARLVDWAVSEDLAGIECLAGIPGLAGATPIQNVGAYGQEVRTTIVDVRAFDRATEAIETFGVQACGFGYRTSTFKRTGWPLSPTGRYVVLEVTFALGRDSLSAPVRYAELAGRLGVSVGDRAPLAKVRDAVLELRRGKGMVLDPVDPDTASAGSFFTNPLVDRPALAEIERIAAVRWPGTSVPRYPAENDCVKVPAGWLIERAGFTKGFDGPGAARISTKHTLALTNSGGATAADLMGLARQVVAGVRETFGVELTNEPTLVGLEL